jgi:hypothetical protein
VITPDRLYSAVCMRGHVITDSISPGESTGVPNFCRRCGAPVITTCSNCSAPILGGYAGMLVAAERRPDPFCWNCGEPYPWATREQRIGHLYNLIDFQDDLDKADRLTIIEQIAVLSKPEDEASDEQRVEAGSVIRRLAPKMWGAALPVLQTVLSAELRRQMGLP